MVGRKLTPFKGQQFSPDLLREINSALSGVDSHLAIGGIRVSAAGGAGTMAIRLTDGTASQAPAAPATSASTASFPSTPGVQRIRVGGNVQASMLTEAPAPEYPPLARQARISGVVRFDVLVGTDGRVAAMQLVMGHPLMVPAAQAAVRQYVYQPTRLNGEPVEVLTQVDVNFSLQ
jgi:protein TonB